MEVEKKPDGTVAVSGNSCPRGAEYARSELVNPMRMVTGLVRVGGMRRPIPVKTKTPVPKEKMRDVIVAMQQAAVQLPVKIGDTIIRNVAGTGVDVVATANLSAF